MDTSNSFLLLMADIVHLVPAQTVYPCKEAVKDMVRDSRWAGAVVALILAGVAVSPTPLRAQEESKRKIKSQVDAVYPELARKYNLSGKVRISVIVTKEGKVKSAKVLGGNAVLANAALDAIKDWKFVAGPDETTEVIEFDFKGRS